MLSRRSRLQTKLPNQTFTHNDAAIQITTIQHPPIGSVRPQNHRAAEGHIHQLSRPVGHVHLQPLGFQPPIERQRLARTPFQSPLVIKHAFLPLPASSKPHNRWNNSCQLQLFQINPLRLYLPLSLLQTQQHLARGVHLAKQPSLRVERHTRPIQFNLFLTGPTNLVVAIKFRPHIRTPIRPFRMLQPHTFHLSLPLKLKAGSIFNNLPTGGSCPSQYTCLIVYPMQYCRRHLVDTKPYSAC